MRAAFSRLRVLSRADGWNLGSTLELSVYLRLFNVKEMHPLAATKAASLAGLACAIMFSSNESASVLILDKGRVSTLHESERVDC
jgi:hypothetical protein